jgi:cell division transport system ATP-binding protein
MEPEVIFADEPTGNLDPQTSWQVVDILEKINRSGITLIMATHNFDIVDSLAKRVVRIEKGKKVSDEKKGKYKK